MKRSFYLQILFKHATSAYGKMVKKKKRGGNRVFDTGESRLSVNDAK